MTHTYPAKQSACAVVPGGQNVPCAHVALTEGSAHALPAGHMVWAEEPAGQVFPELHAVGTEEPAVHMEPAGHWVGTEFPLPQ